MGGSKQKQTQASTSNTVNTFGQISPLDDPRYAESVANLRNFQFQGDPRLPYTFARTRQRVSDTYRNPLGGHSTPQLEDAYKRAAFEDIGQQEAQAYREENFGRQGVELARLEDIAQLSAPRTVQTGGTSSSSGTATTQQQPSILDSVVKGGSLALMAF